MGKNTGFDEGRFMTLREEYVIRIFVELFKIEGMNYREATEMAIQLADQLIDRLGS